MGKDHPFKLRIWNALNRWTHHPRLTVPFAGRGWISLDVRDVLQFWVLRDGDYEGEVWQALAPFAKDSEVVWDVGAHIGIFAIKCGLDSRIAQTYCFEPHPETFAALSANLALNAKLGNFKALLTALSNVNERRTLYSPSEINYGLAGLDEKPGVPKTEVQVKTIDWLIEHERLRSPTLLKIDVEGWELQVLQGAEKALPHVKAVVFEAACDSKADILDPALPTFLRERGFKIKWIERATISSRENYLAWRDSK
jgi:FkbM family methyltransferase